MDSEQPEQVINGEEIPEKDVDDTVLDHEFVFNVQLTLEWMQQVMLCIYSSHSGATFLFTMRLLDNLANTLNIGDFKYFNVTKSMYPCYH